MNFELWLQFATSLATVIARESGKAPRELAYLQVITNAATLAAITDEDLTDLHAKYAAEVAADTPTTADDLLAIAARIEARGERIQAA
jgi:hypothetical protein